MKKILISVDPYETRVAIIEDGIVVETYLERADRRSLLGNVYLSKVDTVLPGMEAAFIDAGLAKNGFLYVDEIVLPEVDDRERRQRRINDLIKSGQKLLCQVVKDPMGTKGARMTMDASFAGRFLVFSPEGKGYGVSKRLPDGERDRLRELVKQLKPRNGGGMIVRTAARGAQREELERDLRLLEDQWEAILARAKTARAPALVHEEVDLALEMVRDDLRVEVDEVVTDDEATYERIRGYVEQHSPEFLPRIKLHSGQAPLMRRYQVEDAIRSTMHRRVDLPSGGYLLFDYAEAFTVIDVNTGRFVGKSRLEDTILRNNLEAAREVVRQLRLRDIGGMIVIDFIDMASARNRSEVISCLQEELKKDRSKVYLTSISPLGLVEMTRQRVTDGVREILTTHCPTCAGEGRVLGGETIAIENLRTLRRHARMSQAEAFLVELSPPIAALMVGAGGGRLAELETSTGKHFSLVGVDGVPVERCAVAREGTVAEILQEAIPVAPGDELEVEVAEPHMFQAADAVAYLDGGYRIVLAGAGPYLGERHTVRIDRVDRLEAYATLLTAKPVSEDEMLALVDHRTDILEPERRTVDRVDLEDRDRRRRTRKPAKTAGARPDAPDDYEVVGDEVEVAVAEAGEEAAAGASANGAEKPARPRRRRRKGADGAAADAAPADGEPAADDGREDDEAEVEGDAAGGDGDGATGPDGQPRRRRRGRRGGRRHRPRVEQAEGAEAADGDGGSATAVAEPAPAPTAAAEPDAGAAATPRPRRRRRTPAAAGAAADGDVEPARPRQRERQSAERQSEREPAPAAAPAPPPPAPDPPQPPAPAAGGGGRRKRGLLGRILGHDE